MGDLIDTTEMCLKTIFKMEEDGATPLRAWIVERLEHSGPAVSQTVSRMERNGLVHVLGDRCLELTPEGRRQATEIACKHRLAERLLTDVIGLEWQYVHEEAYRWEYTMSDAVEERLVLPLEDPRTDSYGSPIPGSGGSLPGESPELAAKTRKGEAPCLLRIGKPIQMGKGITANSVACEVKPDTQVETAAEGDSVRLRSLEEGVDVQGFKIPVALASHLFVTL